MADLKISQLTSATTPLAGTEVVPIVQSGTTKMTTVAALTAGRAVTSKTLTATNSATGIAGSFTNSVTSGWADVIVSLKAASSANSYDAYTDLVELDGLPMELTFGAFANVPVRFKVNDSNVVSLDTSKNVTIQIGRAHV